MMNISVFEKGELSSFAQIMKVLAGCQVKDLEAVYSGEDPEAICMKVITAAGEEKYIQLGSDNEGFTDLSDERLEDNRFYMLTADPDQPEELTLEELKQLRMKFAKKAMRYKQREAVIRNEEMEIFKKSPMADAFGYYFRVYMIAARALNEVIKEREEHNNGKV